MTVAGKPTIVRWQDAAAQPWRNGGGLTRELLTWPAGADWQLRVSVADIDRSGPFSAFPGVSRWFAVLEGAGVELMWPAGPKMLDPRGPACCFDGADAPDCRLLDGPTRDLNLMLRGAAGSLAPVVDAQAWAPAAPRAGLFTQVAGRVELGSGGPRPALLPVPAMSLCWWSESPAEMVFHVDNPSALAVPGWWLTVTPDHREAAR